MKPILAFDVNETLLDMGSLDPLFQQLFKDKTARQQWFSQFIQNAFVTLITDAYQPFGQIAIAALEMLAERKDIKLKEKDILRIVDGIKNMPPHPEVPNALKRLKYAGFQMVTLTNSTEEVGRTQIKNAGLDEYFEAILSADTVKKLKPAKEAYIFAAKQLGVQTNDLMLVASHAWDIAGALNAGCAAAFISRSGAVLDPLTSKPQIIGKNLQDVADKIINLQ
jgi:2-haloacid dehalogenase